MANMAMTSYRIEGPKETLERINDAIVEALSDKHYWTEAKVLMLLGYAENELEGKRVGGEIEEKPSLGENTLEFYAEERWGLQDFNELLEAKFPDIKVYWIVEESGCEVYATNDKEGKYFPERYYVELCLDDQIEMEYFKDEKSMYKWLSEKTGRNMDAEEVKEFNVDYDDEALDDENFIHIHKFEVID